MESREIHLLKVNAATAIRVVEPESPGELLVVGSLPADAHGQQPLPGNEEKGTKAFSMENLKLIVPLLFVSNALNTSSCIFSVCLKKEEGGVSSLSPLPNFSKKLLRI